MVHALTATPAFFKVVICFAAILLCNRAGLSLGWSIVVNSALLVLWSGLGLRGIALEAQSFTLPDNYLLLVVIVLLLFLTEALSKTGRMETTVQALRQWLTNHKMLIAGLPALVGLLPMPGGALFSAPMVDSVDEEKSLDPAHKVAINYWFRHIWEYWWPLYPGVVLAVKYSGLPIGTYLVVMMPFTLLAVAGGYVFILRHVGKPPARASVADQERLDWRAAVGTLGPIAILVCISVAGSAFLPLAGMEANLANLVSMLAGLVVSLAVIFGGNTAAFAPSVRSFATVKNGGLFLVVIGIQAFSAALKMPLDTAGSTLVSLMRDEFFAAGVPIILVMMLLPFISGFITGLALGFVGASFPLVFALLGHNPAMHNVIATTIFCYSFGYVGMLLSPVHICFVVTNEYFKSRIFRAYPYIVGPVATVLLGSLLMSAAFHFAR